MTWTTCLDCGYRFDYALEKHPKCMSVTKKLLKQWNKKKRYYILPDDEWNIYKQELIDAFPMWANDLELWGFPKVSYRRADILRRDLKRGIPCLTYRAIPVFSDKYKKQVEKVYA